MNESSKKGLGPEQRDIGSLAEEQPGFDWKKKLILHLTKKLFKQNLNFMFLKYFEKLRQNALQDLKLLKDKIKVFRSKKKEATEFEGPENHAVSIEEINNINLVQNFDTEIAFFYRLHFDLFLKRILRAGIEHMACYFDRPNLNLIDRKLLVFPLLT